MKRIIAFLIAFILIVSGGVYMTSAEGTSSGDASAEASSDSSADSVVATEVTTGEVTTTETVTTEAAATEKTNKVSLSWSKTVKSLKAGKTFTFKAIATGTDEKIKYSVNKTSIASINKNTGVLKGKKVGKVTVKATVPGKTISFAVNIKYKKIVCIDPGHSGVVPKGTEPIAPGSKTMKAKMSSGTCGNYTHVPEYKLTMVMAKKLKALLVERGYKVVLTRKDNKTAISNVERAKIANNAKADAYLRLHADSVLSSGVRGMSMQYASKGNPYVGKKFGAKNLKLSKCVRDGFVKATGSQVRGNGLVARNDLSGTNWANVPTTLIEMGFMSNPTEDRLMQDKDYQAKMAKGMADGIDAYFGY